MEGEKLAVKMLGGFGLHCGDREIVLSSNRGSKTIQLLQMMLLCPEEGIAKTSLMDRLYTREEVENKNGSLNNTLFRLRKQLKDAGLPESNYILIKSGVCYWDRKIPVELDCFCFEEAVQEGRKAEQREARMEAFGRACRMYTGEFLPDMIGEDWAAVRNIHYRNLYFSCLEELCGYLKEKEDFEALYELTTKAAEIYPFEEWQIWRIDSLIAMSRYKEAMDIYRETTRLFFDELGLRPSSNMMERFQIMSDRISQSAGVIEEIKNGLQEREKRRGAYYCTFPSFVDIYQVISRMMERNGTSVYIMLCTLEDRNGPVTEENDRIREVSAALMETIRNVLRWGDFYTRYNMGQYLIMLSGISHENCGKVSRRIDAAFRTRVKKSEYRLEYYVASVAEVEM